jgi:hypothetical protein
VFYASSITIDLDFFWQGGSEKKKYIDWLNGLWFVDPRIKEGWGFMTFKSKAQPSSVNGFFKLLTEDGVWQTLLKRKYVGSKALS